MSGKWTVRRAVFSPFNGMSWRQLWGSKAITESSGEKSVPLPKNVRHYFPNLIRDSARSAWDFVVENRLPAFFVGILVPAIAGYIQSKTKEDMKAVLATAAWTGVVYLVIVIAVFLWFLLYVVPKRRFAVACGRIEELEGEATIQTDATNATRPILLAIDELRKLCNAGSSLEIAFQIPEATNPSFEVCSNWNDKVTGYIRRQIFSEVIRPRDVAQFIESWDNDECYDAEANLDAYGLLDGVDAIGRVTHRYIFGRVRRLQELLDKIDGKPESRTRIKAHYSANRQECMVPVDHRNNPDIPGLLGVIARLRITSKSEPDIQACKASVLAMYEDCTAVVIGHRLPLRFDPANEVGAEEKNIKFGVPEFLEVLEITDGCNAELKMAFPYAHESRKILDPSTIYALDIALTADNSPALRITLDVFRHDDSWQLRIRR